MSFKQIIHFYIPQDLLKPLLPFLVTVFLSLYSILLLIDGYYFCIFIALGFSLGINQKTNDFKLLEKNIHKKQHVDIDTMNSSKDFQLFYTPLTAIVNQLLDYIMRDFISSWWKPLNIHNDVLFEKLVRERLNVVLLNLQKILLNQERNEIVISTLYGLASTLIIHMRECRALEESNLPIHEYIQENPQSPFSQLLSKEEQHQQLKLLARIFLKRTLPASDSDSLLLLSLINELLTSFVFENVLDNLSDPDYLNCLIVNLLSDAEISSSISETVIMENSTQLSDHEEEDELVIIQDDRSSFEQVTPPDTPKPKQKKFQNMIFNPGSVNFAIMDVPTPHGLTPNKADLVYIIQIERTVEDMMSEGGGYVITRTFADFETFHTILTARHLNRCLKLDLKLPVIATKSWIKKSSSQQKILSLISFGLKNYIDLVVQDEELGTDSIILSFLRKEKEINNKIISFAEEFEQQALQTKNDYPTISSIEQETNNKWLAPKTKKQNVDNSIVITNKSLSSMDIELLIETTYALVIEIFNLTIANNKAWMRRSILNLLLEIVRRSYAEFISEQYSDLVCEYMSPNAIVSYLHKLSQKFWPDGNLVLGNTQRTDTDRLASKQLARELLMTKLIPNATRQLIGDRNCNLAMDRIWARIQDPNLNRVLVLQIFEHILKPIFG